MKYYFALLAQLVFATHCFATEKLPKPSHLESIIGTTFNKCMFALEHHKNVGNQLTSQGLKSCYSSAQAQWEEYISQAEEHISQSSKYNCIAMQQEFGDKWNSYSKEMLHSDNLANAALNTDDELTLLLLAHHYEIEYMLLHNWECEK